MDELKSWQKRYLTRLSNHIDIDAGVIIDDEFKVDIERLRSLGGRLDNRNNLLSGFDTHQPTLFMRKYRLPDALYDFIYHLIVSGEMDNELIGSGVLVVSEMDHTAIDGATGDAWLRYYRNKIMVDSTEQISSELKLIINSDVTPTQISRFVMEKEVREFIDEKQKLIADRSDKRGRVRASYNRKRDLEIQRLVNEGLTYKEVARKVSSDMGYAAVSHDDIATIVSRLKGR